MNILKSWSLTVSRCPLIVCHGVQRSVFGNSLLKQRWSLVFFFLWLDDCWMSSTKGLNLHIKRVINLSKLVFVIQCIYYKKKMPSSATYDKLFKVFSTASCRVWPITRWRLQTYYWYRWNSALTMADGCAPSTSKPVKVFLFCFFTVTQNSTIFIY